jgi:hypothetical protein
MQKEYRVEVKVKNNLMWQAMQSKGIKNGAVLARALGMHQSAIGRYLNLQENVYNKNGDYKEAFLKICDFFDMMPTDLYPEERMNDPLMNNKGAIEIGESELERLVSVETDPVTLLHSQQRSDAVHNLLGLITAREEDVVRKSMGIDGPEQTYAEIGREYGVSRERIKQIHDKALRKMSGAVRLEAVGLDWETRDLAE